MTVGLKRYYQEPLAGLIGPGQMDDICAVPPAAGETLQLICVWSNDHDVRAHAKLPAGRAGDRVACVHVGNAKSFDVLRPPGKNIRHKLKEHFIEASWVVMLGAWRWTR
jgi:hypothetical protein